MRTLLLVRHGKSSWSQPGLRDMDRPLNPRGERDAPEMGRRLARRCARPDLLLASPARRAQDTARVLAEALGYPAEAIELDPRIYDADSEDLLEVLRELDDALERVLCVGHNPGLTDLVNALAPEPVGNLPTCAVAELAFDLESWARLGRGRARELHLDTPKRKTK